MKLRKNMKLSNRRRYFYFTYSSLSGNTNYKFKNPSKIRLPDAVAKSTIGGTLSDDS